MGKKVVITEDIKESWLNPIRAAQAACSGNRGLAIVHLKVVVYKNDALRWSEPVIEKVHPAKLSGNNTNTEILDALLNDVEVDN